MPATTVECIYAVRAPHLSRTAMTPQDDGGAGLHSVLCAAKHVAEIWTRIKKKKIFNFTTGHLRHKLGKHWAVRAVKAVHAHTHHDAMHQYVVTNLSLRDTIRRRQEQPVIGWRESRLTAKERQSGIKDQLCQEDRDTALSFLQSPYSMLFISRSA